MNKFEMDFIKKIKEEDFFVKNSDLEFCQRVFKEGKKPNEEFIKSIDFANKNKVLDVGLVNGL